MPFRSDIRQVKNVVARQLPLDPKIPVIAGRIAEMRVEQDWRKPPKSGIGIIIWDRSGGYGVRRVGQRKGFKYLVAIKTVHRVERGVVIVLLKGRIATGVAKQVAEDAIVKNTECAADRHLPIAFWIPGEADSGFEIGVVAGINLLACARSNHRQSDRAGCGIAQEIGEIRLLFV